MTDNTIVTLVAAIPTTIAAIGALVVALRNAQKADTIIAKADVIHTLANSSLSKVQAALDTANEKIAGLQALVTSINASRSDAAVAAKETLTAVVKRPTE